MLILEEKILIGTTFLIESKKGIKIPIIRQKNVKR